jgi:dnd system-associated protein 4
MGKHPDRLRIDKSDKKLYDHATLATEIFRDKENKEQFLFAAAIGFKNKVKRPLDAREGFVRTSYLLPEDEALIDSIALFDVGSVDILSDRAAVFSIIEEYAHAGIKLLYDEVTTGQPGSFFKKLELELVNLIEEFEINKI